MSAADRFHDNPNGVITDTFNRKEWLPKDSYQDLGKWRNWQEIAAYTLLMRQVYAGGYSDWRLPSKEEALSLYDPQLMSQDWKGNEIHIHPVFVARGSRYIWTCDVNEKEEALRVDLCEGTCEYVPKTEQEFHAARLVRDITN